MTTTTTFKWQINSSQNALPNRFIRLINTVENWSTWDWPCTKRATLFNCTTIRDEKAQFLWHFTSALCSLVIIINIYGITNYLLNCSLFVYFARVRVRFEKKKKKMRYTVSMCSLFTLIIHRAVSFASNHTKVEVFRPPSFPINKGNKLAYSKMCYLMLFGQFSAVNSPTITHFNVRMLLLINLASSSANGSRISSVFFLFWFFFCVNKYQSVEKYRNGFWGYLMLIN